MDFDLTDDPRMPIGTARAVHEQTRGLGLCRLDMPLEFGGKSPRFPDDRVCARLDAPAWRAGRCGLAGAAAAEWVGRHLVPLVLATLVAACGGGGGGPTPPSVRIELPSASGSFATHWAEVRLGGTVERASFIRVENNRTGFTTDVDPTFVDGQGSWFADVPGLAPGANPIVVTADADGTGQRVASARITVTRPDQPGLEIVDGADPGSGDSHWTDESSGGHRLALFADGTGRSTTGSTLSGLPGAPVAMTWRLAGPDAIAIENCPDCAFQRLSGIAGSVADGAFVARVVTVGGATSGASDFFRLSPGGL